MDLIKEFERGLNDPDFVKVDFKDKVRLIYKGFSITRYNDGILFLTDCRHSTFYNDIKPQELKIFEENGFKKACEIIQMQSDELKVSKIKRNIARLHNQKAGLQKANPSNPKIKSIDNSMAKLVDSLFFYNSRLQQLKNKLNHE